MIKKKKILSLIILIIPLLLVIVGFSAWIISTTHKIAPSYTPNHTLADYFVENDVTTYNTQAQYPEIESEMSSKDSFNEENFVNSLYFSYAEVDKDNKFVGDGTYTEGKPTNAGRYSIKIAFTKEELNKEYSDDLGDASEGYCYCDYLTINKATPVINETVSINYPADKSYLTSASYTNTPSDGLSYSGSFLHVENNNTKIEGSIAYSDTRQSLVVGTYDYQYTFTPNDTDNFEIVTGNVSITTYAIVKFQEIKPKIYVNDKQTALSTQMDIAHNTSFSNITTPSLTTSFMGYDDVSKPNTFGWSTTNNTFTSANSSLITSDTTFYYIHTPIVYTITYNLNGGGWNSITGMATYTIEMETDYTLPTASKTGYDFLGWDENGVTYSKVGRSTYGNRIFKALFKKPIRVTLNAASFEYDGSPHGLTATTDIALPSGVNLQYSNNSYTNAGTYTPSVDIALNDEYYMHPDSQKSATLTITKQPISLYTTDISVVYNASKRTWALMQPLIDEQLEFTTKSGTKTIDELRISTDPVSALTVGMNNGIYGYGNNTSYTTTSNVVGSTYLATVSINCNNYQLTGSASFIVRYKTVLVGSTYKTIEEALTDGLTDYITFAGDSTGESTYVLTSFTKIANVYASTSFSLTNRIMYIPYSSTASEYTGDGYSLKEFESNETMSGYVYSALNIPNGITLNVTGSSAKLFVTALVGFKQPNTTHACTRGVIMNDGTINLTDSATLKAYGFIKKSSNTSTGIVNVSDKANIYEGMKTYDWPGGNTAQTIYKTVLPLNAWTFHNISCDVELNVGATYRGFIYAAMSGSPIYKEFIVISSSSSDNCIFVIKEGKAVKKTKNSKATPSDTNLYTIIGSNQIAGQKDEFIMYGALEDAIFNISITTGVSLATSKTVPCPFGFGDIILESGSNVTIKNSSFLFLPGTKLEIMENATLNIDSGVQLSFETKEHMEGVTGNNYTFRTYCVDKESSKMLVSGTLNIISGGVGGKIEPGKEGVNISLSNNGTTTFYSLSNAHGATQSGSTYCAYKVSSFPASGYIVTSETESTTTLTTFSKESYISIKNGNNYYWKGTVGNTSVGGSFTTNGVSVKGCLVKGTLITMADGTKKAVEFIEKGDLVIVFNHETGKYETAEVLFNDTEEIADYNVVNLSFSNGSLVKVVDEHGFFDLDLMKYVYIDEYNYSNYIGHRFVSSTYVNGEVVNGVVTLDNVTVTTEYVKIYSPVTKYHLNYITEDILSMPGGISGIFNIFEYDESLKYNEELMNQDIEQYGLFTYEDFKDLVSYEVYASFPTQYFKIAIAKGILTWEDLYYYIERYADKV